MRVTKSMTTNSGFCWDFNDWKKMSCDKLAASLGMTEAFKHCHGKLCPPSSQATSAQRCIYVRNLTVKDAWVHTGKPWSTLSDHLPLSAELTL